MAEDEAAPAPSAEARRLVQDLVDAVADGTFAGATFDRTERHALLAYVAGLEADARKWRLVRRCGICGTPLDTPGRPWSADCGGDCLACMAEHDDPDCAAAIKPMVDAAQRGRATEGGSTDAD